MNGIRARGTTAMLVFACLADSVFVSGCFTQHSQRSGAKGAPMVSSLVIDLADKPEYQPLLEGKPQTHGMRSGRVYLKPGDQCGRHSTEAHEEMLVFLSGKGTALIGEEKTSLEVGKGRICYIRPHTTHNITNTGTEPLIYIYCVAPVK